MVGLVTFLKIVHTLLLVYYFYEVGLFAYRQFKHRDVIRAVKDANPNLHDALAESDAFKGALFVGFTHTLAYFVAIQAINLPFIVLVIAAIYCSSFNELLSPTWRSLKKRQTQGPRGSDDDDRDDRDPSPRGPGPEPHHTDDEQFGFDPGRFGRKTWSTSDAEADYESALREAQDWANRAASDRMATSFARTFEKKASAPNIHPKDRLRYKLAAMLLTERLKGSAAKPSREATDSDLIRLGLPV